MAAIKKVESKDHRLRAIDDTGDGELLLVRGGKRAYLWVGKPFSPNICTFSGPATLRKLAYAILKEVGRK